MTGTCPQCGYTHVTGPNGEIDLTPYVIRALTGHRRAQSAQGADQDSYLPAYEIARRVTSMLPKQERRGAGAKTRAVLEQLTASAQAERQDVPRANAKPASPTLPAYRLTPTDRAERTTPTTGQADRAGTPEPHTYCDACGEPCTRDRLTTAADGDDLCDDCTIARAQEQTQE